MCSWAARRAKEDSLDIVVVYEHKTRAWEPYRSGRAVPRLSQFRTLLVWRLSRLGYRAIGRILRTFVIREETSMAPPNSACWCIIIGRSAHVIKR